MERSMIIVGGAIRTGRSTLAKSVAENLQQTYETRYISFGETVRAIGKQALIRGSIEDEHIDSFYADTIKKHLEGGRATELLDDEVAWGVMSEALTRTDDAELVIVDGYPKTKTQADDLLSLAINDDRRVSGLLIATVDENEALARMLKRGRNNISWSYDAHTALEQVRQYSRSFGEVIIHLASKNIPFETVDTSGAKEVSTRKGLTYAKSFLE